MAGEEGYTRRDPNQHAGYTRREDEYVGKHRREEADPQTSGGFYNPGNKSPYDDHSGYTRRYGAGNDGYTRRDPNQHAGYTKRGHGGTLSPSDLKNAEEHGQSKSGRLKDLAANGLSGLLNSEKEGAGGKGDTPFNYVNNGPRFGKARGFLQKHRKKVIAGSLAGVGVLPLLALLLFLLGALKIPHFVENVAAWRFAKVTTQYRKTMTNVMNEKNAIDSLDDAAREQVKAKYGKYAVFDKVNRLRPNRVLQSLNASDRIQYEYKRTLTGRQKLVAVHIAPGENPTTKIRVAVPTGRFDRLLHPFKSIDQYKTISDSLDAAMKAHDPKIPALTRSLATKAVLQKAGASLKGMTASKYLGKNTASVDLEDAYRKLAANAQAYDSKLNDLEKAMLELDDAYKAKDEFRKVYQTAFGEFLRANLTWDTAYRQYQRIPNPTQADTDALIKLIDPAREAGEVYDLVKEQEKNLDSARKRILDNISTLRGEILEIRNNHWTLILEAERKGIYIQFDDEKIALNRELYERVNRNGGLNAITNENTREVAQEASDEADKAVKDDAQMQEMIDKGQDVPDSVNNVIERGLNPGNLKAVAEKVVGFANPIYDVAVPICMAYDGSKLTPEGVDAQHDSLVSEAAFVLAVGDQQKDGKDFSTPMANAMNWKLGNIQDSNAIRRVSSKPVNSLDTLGGQRTAMGTYGTTTIFDVFHLSMFNGPADDLCPTLTNIWVGVGIGVVNLAIMAVGSFFTGGASGAAQISASAAAKKLAEETLTKTVKKVITTATKKTIKSFASGGRFAKAYTKSVVKYGAATAAAVFLAQMIVNNHAGLNSSGLEKGVAFADNVDNGAEMLSNDINRANFYARPLNNVEVVQSHRIDRAEMAYNNQQLSTFERYLAFENPNSLVSRMAITTGSLLDRSMFASMLNSLANLFNPVGLSSKLFAGLNATTTLAAGNVNTEDYGNVVWAYSQEEQRLMEQDSYASPSENGLRLEESGKRDEIESKYSKCYDSSTGTLLTGGDITRDEDGDVLNTGDCSPEHLGPNNPDYGDLVFRWRLDHAYSKTTDTLLGIQDPAKTENTEVGNLGAVPNGTVQELATQVLNNGNVSFLRSADRAVMEHIASTGKSSQCTQPVIANKILGVILAASSKYKIVLGSLTDGPDCTDASHSKGTAIDVTGVSTLNGSDSTGISTSQSEFGSSGVLRSFYSDIGTLLGQTGGGEMGQFECFPLSKPTKASGVSYVTIEACDRIHIGTGSQ